MKPQNWTQLFACVAVGGSFALFNAGCGSASSGSTEDSSTSGTVAAMVGGAYNTSGSGGTVTLNTPSAWERLLNATSPFSEAVASGTACPTIGGSATGCTDSSGTLTMTYNGCSFGSASATWSGTQLINFSGGGESCSAFPSSYTGNVTRTFGASTTRTAASGSSVLIDTSGTTVHAADSGTYAGGTVVALSSGVRNSLTVSGINYLGKNSSGKTTFSHSLKSSTLSISNGAIATGTITVIHNLAKVQATSTLTNLTFTAGCCTPTGGSVSTTFSAITGVTPAMPGFVGVTETLQFTGCGTAIYTGPEANLGGNVTLAHCL